MTVSPLHTQPAEIDPFALPVHPTADVFPWLPPDELQELAESIKAKGLQAPIVVQQIDGKTMLIDGRNRLAACRLAGVKPSVCWIDPKEDTNEYILLANITRRHMTKGQQAMAVAIVYPDPTKYKRGGANSCNLQELDGGAISRARTILHHAPDLVDGVLSGATPRSIAHKRAVEQRDQGNPDRAQRKKPRPPKAAKPSASPLDDGKGVSVADTSEVQSQLPPDTEGGILPDNFTKEQLDEAVATIVRGLAPSVVKKIEKSFGAVLQKIVAQFSQQVREKIDGEVATERERLSQIAADRTVELEATRKLRMSLAGFMSLEEFQLVRSCLHPDKHQDKTPEEIERYSRAFELFNRLRATVNTNMPLSAARARGWEKVHPRYKPNWDKKSR